MMTINDIEDQLRAWLGSAKRFVGRWYELVRVGPSGNEIRLCVWTANNVYTIRAKPSGTDSRSYLGCGVSCRRARPGEDWTRGSDLMDGEFSYETWVGILTDILGCEAQEVVQPVKPKPVEI